MAPTLQNGNGKWVTFRMTGGGVQMRLTLPVNPDELQREHPGRITTTQTLGGAYQDINDLGVTQITLNGTTGWRGRPGANMDGLQYAQHLYKYIFEEYYRRARVNPEQVELLLIDGIDGYTWKISIDDMQVFRNKSEPLLFRYNLSMTALQNMDDPPSPKPDPIIQSVMDTTSTSQKSVNTGVQRNTKTKRTYKVRSGDTLWGIANKFKTTVTQLVQVNHIRNPNYILPGWILQIPW